MAILISLWGISICCFGVFMLLKPAVFSHAIIQFSRKRYFHYVEIISRLAIGAALLLDAHNTAYPLAFEFIGNLLFIVAIFLVFITEKYHKKFAISAAKHGVNWFKPAGAIAIVFGLWTVYVSVV
ncbi:hypothetical protein [Shewanella sp.]|uniref:hypothetical protein n=1 Tax=Shewanella sp. TaxID=50422 RepID=UPI004047E9BD